MKLLKLLIGIPKAAVCFGLECVAIPTGIVIEAAGYPKAAQKVAEVALALDKAAGKAIGKIVVVAVLLSLTSCQFCEGVRQFRPNYTPRDSR